MNMKVNDTKKSVIYVQSKLFIASFVITEYSISDIINLLRMDLFPLKFPLNNRIFS